MCAKIKYGLSYFSLDVDLFDDPKVLFIEDRFGEKGELIVIKLLCWIYRDGYYCKWDNEHALIFAKKNFSTIKANLCQEVVQELIKREFFNERLFNSFGILTGRQIQIRWKTAIDLLKRKAKIIPEYNLLVQEECMSETELSMVETEERTLKERKRKEMKGKEGNEIDSFFDIEVLSKRYLANESILKSVSENNPLPVEKIQELMPDFLKRLRQGGIKIKQWPDFCEHFRNWALKQVKNKDKKSFARNR